LANTGFQTVYNNIGLEPNHTAWSYALVNWNSGKWNSVKWNETRRIGAIFASFWVARVCQRQLGFLVYHMFELLISRHQNKYANERANLIIVIIIIL